MILTRRLIGAAAIHMVLASGLAAQAVDSSRVAREYRIEKVANGVFAFIAPVAYGGIVSGNVTAIAGDSAVLVVDSGHFPTLAARMVADIRRLTGKPVRYLVNTHWHPDHWLGNAAFARAYPGLTIFSTEFTRAQIESQWPAFERQYRDSAAVVERLAKMVAQGTSGDQHAYLSASLTDAPSSLHAWHALVTMPPTATFTDRVAIDLGNRRVEIRFLGRGNTDGDAVVFVPDARVAATGDLVVSPTPYAYPPAHITEWIGTLSHLEELGASTYVPGHGEIERDGSYIALVRSALTSLRDQTVAARSRGVPLDSIRTVVDFRDLEQRFTNGDPRLATLFRIGFVDAGIQSAFAEDSASHVHHS